MFSRKRLCVMFIMLFSLLGLALPLYLYEYGVSFRDPQLEQAIRDHLKKRGVPITRSDLLQVVRLNASGYGIRYLDGIEALDRLESLDIDDNRLVDLTPLTALRRLTALRLARNPDLDLQSIAAATSLKELNLQDCRLPDVSALRFLTSLESLNLRGNEIVDLDPLATLQKLTYLNLHSNDKIQSIESLGALIRLQTLILRNVHIGNQTSAFGTLLNLQRLNLRNCGLTDLIDILTLMKRGALQDDSSLHVEASLDVRDNPIDWARLSADPDHSYYWSNVRHLYPSFQPQEFVLSPPEFSLAGGFFSSSFDLHLSHPDPNTTIIYTMDGSEPDIHNVSGTLYSYKNQYPQNPGDDVGKLLNASFKSIRYENPIAIREISSTAGRLSQMSSTTCAMPSYFPQLPIRQATVIRAKAYRQGALPSRTAGHTFFTWPDGNPYRVPVVSLHIQENLLFDYEDGIYNAGVDWDTWREKNPEQAACRSGIPSNFTRRGGQWEYPAFLEIYEPERGEAVIRQGVGFRIHGFFSRGLPNKHLRLYARERYDEKTAIPYKLFDETVYMSERNAGGVFNRLMLRGFPNGGPFINDVVVSRIMQPVYEGMQRLRFTVQFINGEYWGLITLRDRFDEYHLASQYDLDPTNIVITEGHELIVGEDRDRELFRELLYFVRHTDFSSEQSFRQLEKILDIRSYIDHLIPNIYFANSHHEYGFWRTREVVDAVVGDGRWRTYTKDFDAIIKDGNWLERLVESDPFLGNLLENIEFRHLFINRFADHLNTTFHPDRMANIVTETYDEIVPHVEQHYDRWRQTLVTKDDLNRLVAYGRDHPLRQRSYIREYFGIASNVNITVDSPFVEHGRVQVNTIILYDQELDVKRNVYPWTGIYFSDIPIRLRAVPSEGYSFAGWIIGTKDGSDLRSHVKEERLQQSVIALALKEDTRVQAVFEKLGNP